MVRRIFAAVVILALASSTWAADLVDNPAYKAWAPYKPGSYVTKSGKTEMTLPTGVRTTGTQITMKLLEVTPDKVVVELSMTLTTGGRKVEPPVVKQEFPAKVEKGYEYLPQDTAMTKPEISDVKTGTDTVEINGKSLETTTYEATAKSTRNGRETVSHFKIWRNETIPGGVVKLETTVPAPTHSTTTMLVTDYKAE